MKLHEQVRQARIDLGMSQLKLSQVSGVPRSQLRIFEQGGNITLQTFAKLASHLPNLGSVSMGPVELELRHADLVVLRGAILEVAQAAMRAVAMLDAAVSGSGNSVRMRYDGAESVAHDGPTADELARVRELHPIAEAAIALNEGPAALDLPSERGGEESDPDDAIGPLDAQRLEHHPFTGS